jgi:hypothetical protein
MSFFPAFPKPGPKDGSSRPANAPNNGSMGGRPTEQKPTGGSPYEKLLASIAPMPPLTSPTTMPATAPQTAGGEMWPDAQGGGGQQAGGELWPNARAPQGQPGAEPSAQGAAPANPATGGITINVGGAGGQDAKPAAPAQAEGASAAAPANPAAGAVAGEGQPLTPPPPPPPVTFPRQPTDADLARIPDGSEVITPYGTGVKKGGVVERYRLSPAGQEAHKRATLAARERFGRTPFDGDPAAPQWPVVIGGYNFNPWAPPGSEWTKG